MSSDSAGIGETTGRFFPGSRGQCVGESNKYTRNEGRDTLRIGFMLVMNHLEMLDRFAMLFLNKYFPLDYIDYIDQFEL